MSIHELSEWMKREQQRQEELNRLKALADHLEWDWLGDWSDLKEKHKAEDPVNTVIAQFERQMRERK